LNYRCSGSRLIVGEFNIAEFLFLLSLHVVRLVWRIKIAHTANFTVELVLACQADTTRRAVARVSDIDMYKMCSVGPHDVGLCSVVYLKVASGKKCAA